ncbi:ATP-binding cassette domain-containing protein [Gellertiella hungarica]|nr:ATP-binding cassette domain-containing protein [Gellertiella hungarica]
MAELRQCARCAGPPDPAAGERAGGKAGAHPAIPHGRLIVDNVAFVAPNSNRPILQKVGFTLEAGEVLGIIGPSSAGKSTLARILMGILPPTAGTVRLDGANITQWPKTHLGRYLGYLPQEVELFPESVAANICRFERVDDHLVIEAAKLAGVHELILQLPQGYDTIIGPGGTLLSGGYRQRIGLARAVYGMPKFVLLDEPSSNLDAVGDQALGHAIHNLRANGTTVIIISHRSGTIASVDKLLLLKDGQVEAFGDRQSIMNRFAAPTTPQKPAQPVKVINVKPPAAAGQGGQA